MTIFHSQKEKDIAFVSQKIQELRLEPRPEVGFHAEATYWQETERWRRVAEHYSWGYVLFLDDWQENAHATLVAIGKVDLDGGRVTREGKTSHFPLLWYGEMSLDLSRIAARKLMAIPPCLGGHIPDHLCDGGVDPVTRRAEPPCSWRERCMGLQRYCLTNGRDPAEMLRARSPEEIVQLTTRLQRKPVTESPEPVSVIAPEAKPAISEQLDVVNLSRAKRDALNEAAVQISQSIADSLGVSLSREFAKELAVGSLFLTKSVDYISLYRVEKPRNRGIVSFRPRTSFNGFRIQVPLKHDSDRLSGFEATAWKDGIFESAVDRVILDSPAMEEMSKLILELARGEHLPAKKPDQKGT